MTGTEKVFIAADDRPITYYQWQPADGKAPKAIVQIAHGMAEHARRYDRFARFLVKNGYAVVANDHRGHGKTAGSQAAIGYVEDGSFWTKAIADIQQLHGIVEKEFPRVPYFLLGHSMGSFLVRDYISKNGKGIAGAIISATGGDPGILGKIGLLIAKTIAMLKGRKKLSPLLDALSFGRFNAAFKPNRTSHDWLSKDTHEVDKYVADPTCGSVFTTGFFIDLVGGVNYVNSKEAFQKTPKQLPVYMFAGELDPVGDNGKGVKEVFEKYKTAGLHNVQCKLYKNGRHEMLNETNREEVFQDVLRWLSDQF